MKKSIEPIEVVSTETDREMLEILKSVKPVKFFTKSKKELKKLMTSLSEAMHSRIRYIRWGYKKSDPI
jgi:hypothetical protein